MIPVLCFGICTICSIYCLYVACSSRISDYRQWCILSCIAQVVICFLLFLGATIEIVRWWNKRMSGGSFGYKCFDIENEYVGKMEDAELDEMLEDLVKVLHDLEWWKSADYCEKDYRDTVKEFKEKWFNEDRSERLKGIIDKKCDALKNELIKII